jgi:hypothetical protein
MKYAAEMSSGAMPYIPSFMKIGSGIQKLIQELQRQDGHAIAQAVSRRLLTAAVRVQTRVWSCGIL